MLSSLDMWDGMQLFLCAVILFGAYCAALGVIAGRIQNRSGIVPAAMILLCIFGCVGVMLFFVFQVTGESSIVLFMLLVLLSLLIFGGELWFIMQNIRTLNKGGCALLLTYVLAVLAVTLLWRKGGTDSRLQMQLFTGVGEALQKHSLQPVWHMLQNVALFVPVGLLFPLIHPAFDHPGYAVMNGLMLSVWIETIQMITASGTCDVNDILTNTLGTAMGYGTFWIGRGMRK